MTQHPQYPNGANDGAHDDQVPAPSTPDPYRQPPTHVPWVQYPPVVARPVPTILTTLLITLFFGIFGLIPTIMHTTRAREAGQPTSKYWVTFGCVMVGSFLLWILMFAILAGASTPPHPTYYH